MGKRKKGRGKGKRSAMTRRDTDAKRARRVEKSSEVEEESSDDDEDDDDSDADSSASAKPEEGDDEDRRDTSDDEDSGAAGEESAAASAPATAGAEWALFLVRLEKKWTWLETRVLFVALMALTLVLCLWIVLRGMMDPLNAQTAAGTVFRAIAGAAILGGLARVLSRGRFEEKQRNVVTLSAVLIGFAVAKAWRGVGIDYSGGWLDWLQEGSVLTLMGGLKGVSTRLTMTVALLGASLAAASGSHINIDLFVRIIPARFRKAVNVLGGVATAAVCLGASWGLMDHIAIAEYQADRDATGSAKMGAVVHDLGEQFFLWRKQAALDARAFPRVLVGRKWNGDSVMNGREWNEYLESAGFIERYGEEKMAPLRASDEDLDEPRTPFVVSPVEDTRGMMVKAMDLIFPFGFLMMALRFILRALLIGSGHVQAHVEGEVGEDGDREPDGEKDDGPDDDPVEEGA
jgi:TRAP-type C4-dicarboxylate transport system permease small subunit